MAHHTFSPSESSGLAESFPINLDDLQNIPLAWAAAGLLVLLLLACKSSNKYRQLLRPVLHRGFTGQEAMLRRDPAGCGV